MTQTPDGERDNLIITGKFVVTHNLTKERGISIEHYITNKDDKGTINEAVDAAMDVVDRQFVRADVNTKSAQLANISANLDYVAQGYEELIAKRDAKGKLSTVEKQRIDKYDSDVRGMKRDAEFLKAAIDAAKKKLEE